MSSDGLRLTSWAQKIGFKTLYVQFQSPTLSPTNLIYITESFKKGIDM